jgi:hypothetical protein
MRAVDTAADETRPGRQGREGRDFVSCLKHPLKLLKYDFQIHERRRRARTRAKIIEVYFHGLHGLYGPTLRRTSAPGARRRRRRPSAPKGPAMALTASEAVIRAASGTTLTFRRPTK